jgi:2-hydroxy-3-keto-5-methylthiopentenyl-1-phosphate phosphatase
MSKKVSLDKWAVVTDFDGTVVNIDISDTMLIKFGYATKEEVENSCTQETLVEKWIQKVFSNFNVSQQKIADFLSNEVVMRKGFDGVAKTCQSRELPIEIVSGGLDLYIEPLLKKWGLNWIPKYCAKTTQLNKGLKTDYWFLKNTTLEKFKASRVAKMKSQGYKVIFCGDGASDFLAARRADLVFSRYKLYDMCIKNNIGTYELIDFREIEEIISDGQVYASDTN